jgi:hypothetical protein
MDKVLKHKKYREAGVREYWIVDPDDETVSVNILNGGRYESTNYGPGDTIRVHILPGCEVNLADIFPNAVIPEEAETEALEEYNEEDVKNLLDFIKNNSLKLADIYAGAPLLRLGKTNTANTASKEE